MTRRGRRAAVVPVALGLAVVLLAGVLGYLLVQVRAADREQDRDTAVLAAARQTVINLLTVDHSDPKGSLDRVIRGSTGDFTQQLVSQSDSFSATVRAAKVNSAGSVSAAGLRTVDDDHAVALVSAIGTVRNAQAPGGEPKQYRMVLDLQRQADGWLVSKLDFVP